MKCGQCKKEKGVVSMRVYLNPVDGRKSFYRKASMEMMDDGTRVLISYTTAVAKITPDGRLVRLCGYERECSSQTTMRHLASFCVTNGLPKISRKEWNSMPILGD